MSNRILVKSGDNRIWNIEITATEIAHKLARYGNIIIDFQLEAPDISTTELKKVLDYLSDNGISYDQIAIHTGNIIENYDRFKVVKHSSWMYELKSFQELNELIPKEKQIQKHFGCFIGRSNITRLIMSSHLWTNYADKTLLTYHFEPGNDFHRVHLGLEDIIYYFGVQSDEYLEALNLINRAPIRSSEKFSYPIVNDNAIIEICDWYKDIFVDVVCETFSNGNVFFLTEKFWRSVATKTPFIIQGPQYMLRRLKQLGFKTFDRWWDEGYDEDPYLYSQNEIKKILANLSVLSITELETMYKEMLPTLEHNYNQMLNLQFKDFDIVS
jgi:uncharacterized protein YktA (UPF0223 family)